MMEAERFLRDHATHTVAAAQTDGIILTSAEAARKLRAKTRILRLIVKRLDTQRTCVASWCSCLMVMSAALMDAPEMEFFRSYVSRASVLFGISDATPQTTPQPSEVTEGPLPTQSSENGER